MRNPIRTWVGGAARPIHYSLTPARASLVLLGCLVGAGLLASTGCSDATEPGAHAVSERNAADSEHRSSPPSPKVGSSRSAETVEIEAAEEQPVIVFLGTSLTAGYGLEESQAFPALLQKRMQTAGYDYQVVNAGVSGDTSAGGLRRLDWLLRMPVSVLVLELGANDMLRGQGIAALRANLEKILDRTRAAHPDVRFVISGMRAAPNLGRDYAEAFDAIYPALAERYDAALVPFLLEDVAARRRLNQADGIHPTAEGHALIAERLWKTLEPVLR